MESKKRTVQCLDTVVGQRENLRHGISGMRELSIIENLDARSVNESTMMLEDLIHDWE